MGLTSSQEKVVNHIQGNILVSASAGSGKTHTLITRLIRLICQENVSVSDILAVTFTESAATDMKEKLREKLCEKISEGQTELNSQLVDLATADISTLHSFCARLIRSYFFVAGVSPDFKVLDEGESKIIKYESIDKAFREFYSSKEEWFLTLVDRHAYGRSDKNLKELILGLDKFINSEENPEKILVECLNYYTEENANKQLENYLLEIKEPFREGLEKVEMAKRVFEDAEKPKAVDLAQRLFLDMQAFINAPDAFEGAKYYGEYNLNKFEKVSEELLEYKKDLKDARDLFKQVTGDIKRIFGESKSEYYKRFNSAREHSEYLIKVITKFREIYQVEKLEENGLDFNDLEHFALKVLSDEQTRNSVSEKYKYIFVDEYQDTNGVQEALINKIQKNNVLMVGDVKQSIYGFRGCSSDFFSKKEKTMDGDGQSVVRLNENFRSSKAVIDVVNEIFNYCMTSSVYGEDYKGKSELVDGGVYPENAVGRVQIHFLQMGEKEKKQPEKPRIYDLTDLKQLQEKSEINTTASLITEIIDEELQKQYYDVKTKEMKPVTYGDIAVLTRNRNSKFVNELVSGLIAHGIPVSSEASVNVLDFPETKILVNLLKLIDCYSDDLPLACTLKSPIGNVTDEELFEIAIKYEDAFGRNGKGFYYAYKYYIDSFDTPLCKKLKEFDEYMARIRLLADFTGANGILKRVISEKNLNAYFLADRNGNDKIARIQRFVSVSISNGKVLTIKQFLNKIENCAEAFGLSYFATENTVKAMTIHMSKGLEFPVVIVCGLEKDFNKEDERKEILTDREYGFAVKSFDDDTRTKSDTPFREIIRRKQRLELIKEEMRLFYVATTRAKYSLHLTFLAKEDDRKEIFDGANNFMDFLPSSLPVTVHDENALRLCDIKKEPRKVLIGESDKQKEDEMSKNFAYLYPYLEQTTLPLKSNVTSATNLNFDDQPLTYVLFDEPSPDTERGTIAHKLLEYYDFNSGEPIEVQIKSLVSQGVLTEEQIGKINIDRINRAIIGKDFPDLNGFRLYREKSFICNVNANVIFPDKTTDEGVLIQGVIDLLAIKDNQAKIIDYKYSSLDQAGLKAKYKTQLELYSYAVEKVLKTHVSEQIIVNLFTGEIVKLT